jgi:hypothetical protein
MASKSSKNHPKNQNQPEFRYVCSQTLKVKKTPNMNSSHQMKQFDINIVHFGGLNWCQ